MKGLPKAKLFWVRWTLPRYRTTMFAKFRNANAMFVWVGPLEIGWRMPWLRDVAHQLYPHLFNERKP